MLLNDCFHQLIETVKQALSKALSVVGGCLAVVSFISVLDNVGNFLGNICGLFKDS